MVYVAKQLGHGPQLTLNTYAQVVDALDAEPGMDAEQAIRRARDKIEGGGTRLVPAKAS